MITEKSTGGVVVPTGVDAAGTDDAVATSTLLAASAAARASLTSYMARSILSSFAPRSMGSRVVGFA